jgi:hypothetical protein
LFPNARFVKTIDSNCGYSSIAKTRDFKIGIAYEKAAAISSSLPTEYYPKDIVFRKIELEAIETPQ